MSRRQVATAALALLLAVAATACGVSTNDEPQPIARENVPAELLEADRGGSDDEVIDDEDAQLIRVWFLVEDDDGAQLHAVERRVQWPAQAAVRVGVLFDTEDNPSDAEKDEGVTSAIPVNSRLTTPPTQDGRVLLVNLSEDFYDRGGNNFIRAVAQLVFTVTEIPSVEAVRFLDEDGQQIAVPDGDGVSQDDPVGRDDYADLDPDQD